ncbi:MAG: PEP-CTERM sorting domain-containing protein [Pyrinomonadaceae bacterium]
MQKTSRYLFAATIVLALLAMAHDSIGQRKFRGRGDSKFSASLDTKGRTALCHATSSATNPYNYLVLPDEPLSAHFDEHGTPRAGHEQDFFPVDNDCDRSNDNGGNDPGGTPTSVPEPITMLLFGTGLAGIGYASRRYFRKSDENNDD